ncbi:unnamed protein product, partial [Tenebrio molitor]
MADFMGHTFDVHSNHNRMPKQTTRIINISRFLSVVGDKDVYKHKGKTWEKLQLLLPSDNQEEDEELQPVCPSLDHTLDAQDEFPSMNNRADAQKADQTESRSLDYRFDA